MNSKLIFPPFPPSCPSILIYVHLKEEKYAPSFSRPAYAHDSIPTRIHHLQDLRGLFSLTSSFDFLAPLECPQADYKHDAVTPSYSTPPPTNIPLISTLICHLNPKSLKREALLLASLLVIHPGSCIPLSQPH